MHEKVPFLWDLNPHDHIGTGHSWRAKHNARLSALGAIEPGSPAGDRCREGRVGTIIKGGYIGKTAVQIRARLKSDRDAQPVGRSSQRGIDVRENLLEHARRHERSIGEGQLTRWRDIRGKQRAHHHAQRDIDHVIAGTAAIRKTGNIAANHPKIILLSSRNGWRGSVEAKFFRQSGAGLVQTGDARQEYFNEVRAWKIGRRNNAHAPKK